MKKLQGFVEHQVFGVCTKMAERLGIATSSIRLSFIYASFFTFGSPIIVYMLLAFAMNIRKHLRRFNSAWYY